MARTKQTARKSTDGPAPRVQGAAGAAGEATETGGGPAPTGKQLAQIQLPVVNSHELDIPAGGAARRRFDADVDAIGVRIGIKKTKKSKN